MTDSSSANNNTVINNTATEYIELYNDASNNKLINNTATDGAIYVGDHASNNVYRNNTASSIGDYDFASNNTVVNNSLTAALKLSAGYGGQTPLGLHSSTEGTNWDTVESNSGNHPDQLQHRVRDRLRGR